MGTIDLDKREECKQSLISNMFENIERFVDYFVVANEINSFRDFLSLILSNNEIEVIGSKLLPSLSKLVSSDDYLPFVINIFKKLGNHPSIIHSIDSEGLIHQASAFGANQTIEFLLSKGAVGTVKDSLGQTPLLWAANFGRIEAASILVRCRGDSIHIADNQNLRPYHISMLRKDGALKAKLKEAGDSYTRITLNNRLFVNERAFAKCSQSASFELPEITFPNINAAKGFVNFFKAIALDKKNSYQTSITFFQKYIADTAIENTDEKLQAVSLLTVIYEIYKFEGSENLASFLNQWSIELGGVKNEILLYTTFFSENLAKANFNIARDYAYKAYNLFGIHEIEIERNFPEYVSLELRHNILFNLGCAEAHFDFYKALDWYEQASSVGGYYHDHETIMAKSNILLQLGRIEEAAHEIEKDSNIAAKNLIQLAMSIQEDNFNSIEDLFSVFNFKYFNEQWLLTASNDEKRLYSNVLAETALYQKDYDKAIDFYTESLKYCVPNNITEQLCKILDICKEANYWQKGLSIIESFYELYPDIMHSNYYLLKYQEFIFREHQGQYEEAQSCRELLFNSIGPEIKKGEFILKAQIIQLLGAIEANNKTLALEIHASLNLKDGVKNNILQYIQSIFSNSQETSNTEVTLFDSEVEDIEIVCAEAEICDLAPLLEQEVVQEPISEVQASSDFELEMEIETTFLDPQAIHAYFQNKKQKLMQESLSNKNKLQKNDWSHAEEIYNTQDSIIHKVHSSLYAAIDGKIISNLEEAELSQFTQSLKKGMAKKEYNSNGIKVIKNKCIELKINADKRLVATKSFKNSAGDTLIVFDSIKNHRAIERMRSVETLKIAREVTLFNPKEKRITEEKEEIENSTLSPSIL